MKVLLCVEKYLPPRKFGYLFAYALHDLLRLKRGFSPVFGMFKPPLTF